MPTVKITDHITSIRLHQKFGYTAQTRKMPYNWCGRVDVLTPQEIENGLRMNPSAIVMPISELRKIDADPDWITEPDTATARMWPSFEGGLIMMHLHYPAYTELPEGETGEFIEFTH